MQGGSYFLVTLLCYLLPSPTPLAENRSKVAVKRGQSQINLSFAEWEQARHKIVSIGVENRPNWKPKIWHRREIVVPLPLQKRCNGECGRRLSKGQASLPLRSPCTTLALSIRNDKALAEKMLGGANFSPRRRSLKGKETNPRPPLGGGEKP